MKRKIYSMVWLLLVWVCGMTSCSEESGLTKQDSTNEGMLLDFMTRANEAQVEAGEDRFNENTVTKADVFFFNKDKSGNCIYAQVGQTVTGNKLNVKLDSKLAEGQDYYVYVIANASFSYTNESALDMTLNQLKEQIATTDWNQIQEASKISLLMDGGAVLTVNKNVSGNNIELTRAMAKVALFATASRIVVDGKQYEPDLGKMKVNMVYLVNKTNLKGDYTVQAGSDYITKMSRTYQKETDKEAYYHIPFYSYPNPANTENRNNSYLELIIPWYVSDGGPSYRAENYYYRIPITGSDDMVELLRNHYYKVNVNVEVLGSLNPEEPVVLEPDFLIMDWYSAEISADMQNYRYLVLNEYESYVYNNDELLMPYVSSSEIDESKTKITKVEYWDYHQNESYKVTLTESYKHDSKNENSTVYFNDFSVKAAGDNKLRFSHVLSDDDFVEFVITVQTYNKQGVEADTWTIHQFPAIYIVGEKNDNGTKNRFVYGIGGSKTSAPSEDGRNPHNCNDDNDVYLGGVSNPNDYQGTNTNSNKNQYNVYVTSFDVGDNYAIGDPRKSGITFDGLQKKDNNGTRLTNYYLTKETEADDIIVPAFKVASSWGLTYKITFEAAQERCASYQENGYPAGRWRVPTKAEIRYIMYLSDKGKIPMLFDKGAEYWVSSGYVKGDSYTQTQSGIRGVRCVYDVWYWGNDQIADPTKFTWGNEK